MPPMLAYILSCFLLLGAASPAAESIGGTLQQGGPQGDPIPGVELTVSARQPTKGRTAVSYEVRTPSKRFST